MQLPPGPLYLVGGGILYIGLLPHVAIVQPARFRDPLYVGAVLGFFTVALMPCSAQKFECNRPEMAGSGFKDVDDGLTTREMAQMIKEAGIHLPDMPGGEFDEPFGTATGSGVIFGATGGVMEAAVA